MARSRTTMPTRKPRRKPKKSSEGIEHSRKCTRSKLCRRRQSK